MKVRKFESIEEWKTWRLGKITGSRLKDIVSKNGRKVASYALVAESWIGSAALAEEEENAELAMERGKRLEPEAIERFKQETGKEAVWHDDDIGWERDDESRIAISPDASIGKTEAVEAKCLTAKRHIEAFLTRKIPTEPINYNYQKLQYFIANEKLRKLYFVFYHPLFPKGLDYFVIEVNRKDIKKEIQVAHQYQIDELKWVRDQVNELGKYVKAAPMVEVVAIGDEIVVANGIQILDTNEAALDRMSRNIKQNA